MEKMGNLRIRKAKVNVKGTLIEYDEYYLVDEMGEEIFDRNIEIENDKQLYDIYKKQNNLLTNSEIKKIRQKYGLTQKEYALVIGVGEVTVHRFENGAIQTEAIDSIMKLSNDPDNMAFLLLQNRNNIDESLYSLLLQRVSELQTLKRHALVDIDKFDGDALDFKEEDVIDVAKNIIKIYNAKVDKLARNYDIVPEYITNLKLQKLLYFVQAICLMVFGKKAFSEKILAWSYGPVVNEVYQEYKQNHDGEIKSEINVKKLSSGLNQIILEVVNSYGSMEAGRLIDFTHEEDVDKAMAYEEEGFAIINAGNEELKDTPDSENIEPAKKRELTQSQKEEIVGLFNSAIDNYNTYLTKKPDDPDKEKIESQVTYLNHQIQEYNGLKSNEIEDLRQMKNQSQESFESELGDEE